MGKNHFLEFSVDPGIYNVGVVAVVKTSDEEEDKYFHFTEKIWEYSEEPKMAALLSRLYRTGNLFDETFRRCESFWLRVLERINALVSSDVQLPYVGPFEKCHLVIEDNDLPATRVVSPLLAAGFIQLGGVSTNIFTVHPRCVWRTMKPLVLKCTPEVEKKPKRMSRFFKKRKTMEWASMFLVGPVSPDEADAFMNYIYSVKRKRLLKSILKKK